MSNANRVFNSSDSTAPGDIPRTRDEIMRAFDALPRDIREFINYAALQWGVPPLLKAIQQGLQPTFIIEYVKTQERIALAADRKAVWNIDIDPSNLEELA